MHLTVALTHTCHLSVWVFTGIEPKTFALLAQCSTNRATGTNRQQTDLDLTVDKQLFHSLAVSFVKSRMMHPDPKRQRQFQVGISYGGNYICHLTKQTDIHMGTLHFASERKDKTKRKWNWMDMFGGQKWREFWSAVRWTANGSRLSLKQQGLGLLHASAQWSSGTSRISLKHTADMLELLAHEDHACVCVRELPSLGLKTYIITNPCCFKHVLLLYHLCEI